MCYRRQEATSAHPLLSRLPAHHCRTCTRKCTAFVLQFTTAADVCMCARAATSNHSIRVDHPSFLPRPPPPLLTPHLSRMQSASLDPQAHPGGEELPYPHPCTTARFRTRCTNIAAWAAALKLPNRRLCARFRPMARGPTRRYHVTLHHFARCDAVAQAFGVLLPDPTCLDVQKSVLFADGEA